MDGTPYWIEAKRCKRTNIHGAMKQASEATDGRPPLAITKRDREPALVTMEYATWFDLMLCLSEADLLGKLPRTETVPDDIVKDDGTVVVNRSADKPSTAEPFGAES